MTWMICGSQWQEIWKGFGNYLISGNILAEYDKPIIVQPKTPHIAKSTNGCKLICITIPSSKGYPDGKN